MAIIRMAKPWTMIEVPESETGMAELDLFTE